MAHSDVFIFLNSITWVFFLFSGFYFILVAFFLPSLYKKIRLHALVKGAYTWKFSAKLLNFFIVKLVLLGARLPAAYVDFFFKRASFYLSSFYCVDASLINIAFSKLTNASVRSLTFKLFF